MTTILVTVILAVLAGTGCNNRWIDDVSRRFDDVNRRFDDVHRRIDDLRVDTNARFAQVDARLSELRQELQTTREDGASPLSPGLAAGRPSNDLSDRPSP